MRYAKLSKLNEIDVYLYIIAELVFNQYHAKSNNKKDYAINIEIVIYYLS